MEHFLLPFGLYNENNPFYFLTLKSDDHLSGVGKYAVIITKYSFFGAHTTWMTRFFMVCDIKKLVPLLSSG